MDLNLDEMSQEMGCKNIGQLFYVLMKDFQNKQSHNMQSVSPLLANALRELKESRFIVIQSDDKDCLSKICVVETDDGMYIDFPAPLPAYDFKLGEGYFIGVEKRVHAEVCLATLDLEDYIGTPCRRYGYAEYDTEAELDIAVTFKRPIKNRESRRGWFAKLIDLNQPLLHYGE